MLSQPKKGFVIPRKSAQPSPPPSPPGDPVSPVSTSSNLSNRQKEQLEAQNYVNRNNFTEERKREQAIRNTINYTEEEEAWAKTFGKNNALRSNVFTNNSSVWSPQRLDDALVKGDIKTVEEYIRHGFDMTIPIEDQIGTVVYPILTAIMFGHPDIVKLLLSAGVPFPNEAPVEEYIQLAKDKKIPEIQTILEAIKKNRNVYNTIITKSKGKALGNVVKLLSRNEQGIFFRQLEDLVSGGDDTAMFQLAYFYATGTTVGKNLQKAYDLIKKAAEKENINAMYVLACILNKEFDTNNYGEQFRTALRIQPNKEEAIRLIKFAAKKGHREASMVERKFIPVTNNNMNELANMFAKTSLKGGRKTRRAKRRTHTRKH
jgi:TPR repeat protein